MRDKAQDQQRDGEIMPRFAQDQAEQVDQAQAWESFARIPVVPRRAPWPTPGSDDSDILAQVSDHKLVVNKANAVQVISSSPAGQVSSTGGGTKVAIRLLTRVYVSGTNLLAEYTTYQIDATKSFTEIETIAEGASC